MQIYRHEGVDANLLSRGELYILTTIDIALPRFRDLLTRSSVTMSTYARDTRLRLCIVTGYCDRNCHYTMLHAREFDFSEKNRAPSLPSLRVTLARERVQTRSRFMSVHL